MGVTVQGIGLKGLPNFIADHHPPNNFNEVVFKSKDGMEELIRKGTKYLLRGGDKYGMIRSIEAFTHKLMDFLFVGNQQVSTTLMRILYD